MNQLTILIEDEKKKKLKRILLEKDKTITQFLTECIDNLISKQKYNLEKNIGKR